MSGVEFPGSVMVLPEATSAWPLTSTGELTLDAFAPVLAMASSLDVFLLGCGQRMELLSQDLRAALRDWGLVVDTMATGSACRSYNVLVTEGRSVAAALIAV